MIYTKFYQLHGVRQAIRMKNPRASLLKEIELPKNSYLHYADAMHGEEPVLGIEQDNPFVSYLPKQNDLVIFHQTDYSPSIDLTQFALTRHTMQKAVLIKDYHRHHPNFIKGFVDRSKAGLISNLVVKNHTLVGAEFSYTKNILSEYNRLHNYWQSVMDDISKTILTTTRQHFLPIQLPSLIPSRSQLLKWETESKESNWKKIATQERLMFAEFYAWLKQDGSSIIPSDPTILDRLNIIFYHKYFYFVVNLGLLKGWITPADGKDEGTQELPIRDARKYLLLGSTEIVMNTIVASDDNGLEAVTDEENGEEGNLLAVGGNKLDSEGEFDHDESLSVSDDEGFEKIKSQGSHRHLNVNKAFNQTGINSVAELLKIGNEKNAGKTLTAQEAKVLFNSEEDEVNEDEEKLEALESLNADTERRDEKIEILKELGYTAYKSEDLDLSTLIDERVDVLMSTGRYSTSEIRRFKTIGRKWEQIKDPKGSNKLAPEIININPADLVIEAEVKLTTKEINGVLDKGMMNSSLKVFNQKYIDEILPRHMMAIGINLQRSDVCVTDYKVTKFENAFDAYEIHSYKLIPLEGEESTVKIKIPIAGADGSFMASGVMSKMRTQRVDLPIRKINFFQVALSSYVSQFFVARSDLSAYSQERWLEKQLIGISNDRLDIKINFADCYHFDTYAPIKYTILSRIVSKIETKDYIFSFDSTKQETLFGADLVKEIQKSNKNQIVVGKSKVKTTILIMAEDSTIFECSTENVKDITPLGTFESFLGLDITKSPLDMLDINISGKTLPIVFVLGYYLGLGNLLTTIGAKFERHQKGKRLSIEDQQFAIKFADETLVFDRRDFKTMLIVGGFKQIKDHIKNYSVYEFDLKEVYGTLLMDMGMSARYTKELDLMRSLWIDPITRDTLREMGEPTDFIDLLLRASEMLVTDKHELGRDEKGFRLRGYERFAGFAYREMVDAVRVHNNKPSKANSKIEVNPVATWMKILQDQTTAPVEDSNPIHSIKESEVVVYRGQGGRDARTLNSESRKYHENSISILSDATVDNGDAGTVVYLTADPNLKSLLGTSNIVSPEDRKKINPTRLLTTTSLLSPCIEFDDPKRRNFASIQQSRTTNCVGMSLMPVRTGYEKMIAYRAGPQYAAMASEDGIVELINKNVLVAKYKSGKKERYPLGKRFGKWQGKTIPHELVTELKTGDKFSEGDNLTYSPAFFQYDWVAGAISYKQGLLGRVALVETPDTLEDGSAMSSTLGKKLDTYIVHTRDIPVEFTREVTNLVKVGAEVEYETLLCTMLDELTTASNDRLFTGESREILADISSINPKAEVKGKVVGIEAVYCGEPEDMSESLRAIVEKCDREKSTAASDQGKARQDGSANAGYRIEGLTIDLNSCIIRVRIESLQDMGNGSKVVNSHQMKSVSGRIWEEEHLTESGLVVDEFFGYQSLQNRTVNSPELLGTTCNLLNAGTLATIKAYRGK